MSNASFKLLTGDATTEVMSLDDKSIYTVVTSPPYYGLRDYDVDGQIGLEETPEEYVEKLVSLFREVKRVLKDDGTLWVNLGDSYNSGATGKHSNWGKKQTTNKGSLAQTSVKHLIKDIKPKDLIGIPWLFAFAMRNDGWYLRQDIIWHKPNPMPESVKDRCTKSHEYIFLFSKSQTYYFDGDAIKEDTLTFDDSVRDRDNTKLNNTPGRAKMGGLTTNHYEKRNKRDVWSITTKPFKGAHFATFPEDLILPCILAGCPENETVLDPFNGSGTTGVVALKNNRNYIGIDLNKDYIKMADDRLKEITSKPSLW